MEEEGFGEDDGISVYRFASSTTVSLEGGAHITGDLKQREKRMMFLHKAMKVVTKHLQECDLKGFLLKTHEVVEWKFVSLLSS